MSKKIYDNYVYMTICDVTLSMYKKTGYTTHLNFCKTLKASFMDTTNFGVYKYQNELINLITSALERIYCMDDETMGNYIIDYFNEEKYLIFESLVLTEKHFFPNSTISKKG
jgi:hypothetical protein